MTRVRRTTDFGTVVLHALLVMSWLVLVATGLRIATDDPDAEWLAVLDPVLPVQDLWFNHLVASAVLTATLAAYLHYVRRARLTGRVRLDRSRLVALLRPGSARWSTLGVVAYWVMISSFIVEIATGILLFAGYGGSLMAIHRDTTFVSIVAIVSHVGLHAAQGGAAQVTRVLRPAPLVIGPPPPDLADLLAQELARREQTLISNSSPALPQQSRRTDQAKLNAHPLAMAMAVAIILFGLAVGAEQNTRPTLRIVGIGPGEAPRLDGDISDPVWANAPAASVLTTQGGDFGGTHEALVEVRAVHDGINVYFAFVWSDPTRSLKHMPLIKRNGGWAVAASREDLTDEAQFNEDKLAILIARSGLPLIGGAIHLARRPLSDKPPSSTGRGLHYTVGGGIADLWQWRASHGGPNGYIDNGHFGAPAEPDQSTRDPAYQYPGGFALDPGPRSYESNIIEVRGNDGRVQMRPKRLPRDPAQVAAALGRAGSGPAESESEGSRWWMLISETVPYSPAADAAVPEGAVIPSVLIADHVPASASSIRGQARWAAGRWTLEVARRLYTGSPHDVPIKSGNLMWVAAFDHAEKRHTRHLRPFRLEVD